MHVRRQLEAHVTRASIRQRGVTTLSHDTHVHAAGVVLAAR